MPQSQVRVLVGQLMADNRKLSKRSSGYKTLAHMPERSVRARLRQLRRQASPRTSFSRGFKYRAVLRSVGKSGFMSHALGALRLLVQIQSDRLNLNLVREKYQLNTSKVLGEAHPPSNGRKGVRLSQLIHRPGSSALDLDGIDRTEDMTSKLF